jgi:hypothetical protein
MNSNRTSVSVVLAATLFASRALAQTPERRYLTTATPLAVGIATPLCIAVDTLHPARVWWWQPGNQGCRSRSTGPGIFVVFEPRVATDSGQNEVRVQFRLPLHAPVAAGGEPFADIVVSFSADSVLAVTGGARVAMLRRSDLAIPGPPGLDDARRPCARMSAA